MDNQPTFKVHRFSWIRKPRLIAAVSIAAIVGTATMIFTQASAATYYVSPTGSDTNNGTSSTTPFKTIQKALDVASAGTTINLAPGVYKQALFTKVSGTADNPITIQGPETGKDVAGRNQAVIYGTGGRVLSVNHNYYTFKGFTIDGQEKITKDMYPTSFSQARSFKDSVQSLAVDSKLIYIGASDTSADITGVKVDDMYLVGAGGECVRMRNRATNNVVSNSLIQWCGMYGKGDDSSQYKYHNAEGVYVGTSPKSTTQPMYANDTSSGNVVTNSIIRTFGSECFNVKENAHDNAIEHSECMYNDEPSEFAGSNIEFRGDHNRVEDVIVKGSKGYNVKLRSDSSTYDRGGNSVKLSTLADSADAAINSTQATSKMGEFCGITYSNNASQLEGNSVGDTTKPCVVADTQAPTVSFLSPVANDTVSGTVTLKADASDNAGVTKVEFLANGALIGNVSAAPYELPWATPTPNGTYTLTVKAYDAANNVGTADITVQVGNDDIAPSAPADLTATAASPSEVKLSWSATTDNVAVTAYDIYRNNTKVASTPELTYSNTGLTPNTTYSYYIKAVDARGNQSDASATVNVTTPTPPGINIEAESGILTSPMTTASDVNAQGGKYVVQPSGTGTGKVVYTFNVATSGTYSFNGRVIAPSSSSDTFNYAFDSASQKTWTLPSTARTSWTWAKAGTVSLTAGTHKLTVYKKENGARLDAISLTLDAATVTPTAINATSLFEAEAGTVSGGVSIQSDSAASGGKYVIGKSSGTVTYTINVPSSGTYMIAGWVKAANSSSDSFNVKVDSGTYTSWDLQDPTSSWTYDATNNPKFTLSAGNHTLTLQYREYNASVDRLILVKQ